MKAGVPEFVDAAGTIEFIRKTDRIFDFLNSSSIYNTGYKKPISVQSLKYWTVVVKETEEYLKFLSDASGTLIVHHPKKAFVRGLIMTSSAVLRTATKLLTEIEDPFPYVKTYKMSQDHLELLFRYDV